MNKLKSKWIFLLLISLSISGKGLSQILFSDDFETDKGWILTGEFERGEPLGLGGDEGNADPLNAYNGTNVLGYDLSGLGQESGAYEPNMGYKEATAISPTINCVGVETVILKFHRWLNVDLPQYDHVYIDVSNDNGVSWIEVYSNLTYVCDGEWVAQEIDITDIALGSSQMKVRFSVGATDGAGSRSGWNIDDFVVEAFDPSVLNTSLGSTINVWDWTAYDYEVHINNNCSDLWIPSPFKPTNNENLNIQHLYAPPSGIQDLYPEDGWELLYKNFGTVCDPSNNPTFMLYNRYESNIRIFVYVISQNTYNQAGIDIAFYGELESALLGYVNHPERALDNFEKQLRMVVPNAFSNGANTGCNGYWLFADIPVAYDPCTFRVPTTLKIEPYLIDFQTINLSIEGGGTITEIVSGGSNGSSSHTSVLSTLNGLGKGSKTTKSLQGFYNNIESIAGLFDLVDFSMGSNSYKDNESIVSDGVSSQDAKDAAQKALDKVDKRKEKAFAFPKWAKAIPKIGVAIDVIRFIIGGGKSTSKPKPTSFEADLVFSADGDITTKDPYGETFLCVPGSKKDGSCVSARKPIYDNILGVFTLLETPKAIRNGGVSWDNSGLPEYETVTSETQFKLQSDIKYAINPASGLILDDISARFVVSDAPSSYGVYSSSFGVEFLDQITNTSTGKRFYKSPMLPLNCITEYVLDLSTSEDVNSDFDVILDFADLDLYLEVNVLLKQNPTMVPPEFYDPNADKVFVRHTYKVDQIGGDIVDDLHLGQIKSHEEIGNLSLTEDMTIYAWSTINITGTIVTNGHHLTVIAGSEITGNVSDLPDEVDLIIGTPMSCGGGIPPQTSDEIASFCGSSLYEPSVAGRPANPTNNPKANTPESNSYLKVSPNPFQDYFKVTYSLEEDKDVIGFLRNVLGEVVKEVRLEGGATDKELVVDCADLGTGIYFLTIQTESDLKTVKLVKQAQ